MINVITSSSCSSDSFSRTFIIKGNANNGRNPPSCPFPDMVFINEKAIGCINEEAIGAINEAAIGAIIGLISSFLLFYFIFSVLVAPSINRPDFYSDSTILIISSISSFEMNKVNLFPGLTAPAPLIFLSIFSNRDDVANLGKTSLAT